MNIQGQSFDPLVDKASETACYLCGGLSHVERCGQVRDNLALKVLECRSCGLVFLSSVDHISFEHYEQSGMHDSDTFAVEDWVRESDADDSRRFEFLRASLPEKRLLDFGCGAGGFLSKAQGLASHLVGVEPESRLSDYFRRCGLHVFSSLEAIVTTTEKFDLITAFHVVEHLPDPRETLRQLSKLTPTGELIIEVPSSDDALLTLYECDAFTRFTYWSQHLFLFNPRTLEDLIRQAGLKLNWLKQVQRYPLSNHLYWLATGNPGGHKRWAALDSAVLHEIYSAQLGALGKCDTLLASISCG